MATTYLTSSGSEIDLILEKGSRRIAIECKGSTSPTLNRGFWNALGDIEFQEVWIVVPVKDGYPIEKGVRVVPPLQLIEHLMSKER